MRNNSGLKYLKDYIKKSSPHFEDIFKEKLKESKKISTFNHKLFSQMHELAKGGKRFRGGLVALGYELATGTTSVEIYKTSLFIEIFHLGLLIHDDFMDEDRFRRGVTTIHEKYRQLGPQLKVKSDFKHFGEAIAVCAGDIALFWGYEILASAKLKKENVIRAVDFYSKNTMRVAHGQALDVTNIPLNKLSEKHILKILQLKSAEYSGMIPIVTGAILGGLTDKRKLQAIEKFGLSLGWAFQITDDILGIFADERELGKPLGSDLQQAKNTLIMLYLFKHGNKTQRKLQKDLFGKQKITKKDLREMRKTLKESGSYQYTVGLARKYAQTGMKQIPKITQDKRLQRIMEDTIIYMTERTN